MMRKKQINVFQTVQTTFSFSLFLKCIFKIKEVRNELADMPLVNEPVFIQNIFFPSSFTALCTGENLCIQNIL